MRALGAGVLFSFLRRFDSFARSNMGNALLLLDGVMEGDYWGFFKKKTIENIRIKDIGFRFG